jgi:hypothetical protein
MSNVSRSIPPAGGPDIVPSGASSVVAKGAVAALVVACASTCVWSNGTPVLAAPVIEDHIISAPPPLIPEVAWSDDIGTSRGDTDELRYLTLVARTRRDESPRLREAERVHCAGMSEEEKDVSPFFHRGDFVDVAPLQAHDGDVPGRLEGAVVTFRRVEGLTAERLQRDLACQAARYASVDHAEAAWRWCPLEVRDVTATVVESARGLEVRLVALDAETAAETYFRAQSLWLAANESAE